MTFLKQIIHCLLLILLMSGVGAKGQAAEEMNHFSQKVVWQSSQLGVSELAEGLAGSFFGTTGNYFIMAGGSAFPNGKPWEGGQKVLSNRAVVLAQQPDETFQVVYHDSTLLVPVADGAGVSLSSGVLCMGGQTDDGISSAVFLLTFDGQEIKVVDFPRLPYAVKNAAAAVVGEKVYLAGGEGQQGPATGFWMLDSSNPAVGWQSLPDLPQPTSGASMVAQMDGEEVALFLIGGRAKTPGQMTTSFYSNVYHFRPSVGRWTQRQAIRPDNKTSLPLAVATATPLGATHILVAGGDNGIIYNQVEAAIHQMGAADTGAVGRRDSLWQTHSGFNNRLLIYNTITDSWFEAGTWRGSPVAVASATSVGNRVYIAGGEVKPGIRSSAVYEIIFTVTTGFGWVNYLVLAVYFIGMLLLGFYFMKREGDTNDFFKAGGRIPWWAAGISIFATTLSAITFIAIPAKSYATDWRMLLFNLTIILAAPLVIRYFLPFFRRFNFDTAYQYLEVRFNRTVRWLAALLFVLFMVSRIAIVLFLPSLALHTVTGFSVYWAILIMGVVTIVYCTSGGIEAVVWGDVIQGFILITGAFMAFVFMVAGVEGGLSTFWDQAMANQKFQTFDFRFDFSQPVLWVVLIGGMANTMISYTSDQSVVQRYMTTRDEKATARSIWLNGFLSIPVSLVFFLLGTGLYVFYTSSPDKLGVVNPNIDSVFPQFIISEMPAGLAGLLIAAIFAAAMSTLSSNINSVAAVVTSDFYKTLWKRTSEKTGMQVARWSGILVGTFGIAMALMLATWNIASLWDQFNTFLGLLTGGLGALFVMGIFFPRIGAPAALIGTTGGLIALLVIKNYTNASFLLYGFAGMATTILIALMVSVFIKSKSVNYTWWSLRDYSGNK